MLRIRHQISDVIYNAATQSFEAVVTFHGPRGKISHACAFPAPLDTSYEAAAEGLLRAAMIQAETGSGLRLRLRPVVSEGMMPGAAHHAAAEYRTAA